MNNRVETVNGNKLAKKEINGKELAISRPTLPPKPSQLKNTPKIDSMNQLQTDNEYYKNIRLFCSLQVEIEPDRHFYLKHQYLLNPEDRSGAILWLVKISSYDLSLSRNFPFFETVNLLDRVLSTPHFPLVAPSQVRHLIIACLTFTVRALSPILPHLHPILLAVTEHDNPNIESDRVRDFERSIAICRLAILPIHLTCSYMTAVQIMSGFYLLSNEEVCLCRMILEVVIMDIDSLLFTHMTVVVTVTSLVLKLVRKADWRSVVEPLMNYVDPRIVTKCANKLIDPVLRSGLCDDVRSKYKSKELGEVGFYRIERVAGSPALSNPKRRRSKSSRV